MSQNLSSNPAQTEQPRSQPAQLEGRTVVIFGGTSGIGLAAAIQAKAAGAKVIVIGLERDRAQQVAAENGFDGWRAADVTRSETIYEALADIPRVDHLAMLAGTFVAGKVLEADIGHLRKAFKESLPLHRFGTPAEAGAAVVFLMSNGWITGATLHADGGVRLV
jgi:NAD(P)-dependent dehydrogenase (short-subunit alcohol dehydrogenase family)